MVGCFQREQETVCVESGQPARHPRPTVRRPAPGPRYGFLILDLCGPSIWLSNFGYLRALYVESLDLSCRPGCFHELHGQPWVS